MVIANAVSEAAASDLLLMCSLCIVGAWFGYHLQPPRLRYLHRLTADLSVRQILPGTFLLITIGIVTDRLIGALPEGTRLDTGLPTILLFFTNWVIVGFGFAIYGALRFRKSIFWILAMVAAIVPFRAAVYYGRREPTVLFVMSIGMAVFFVKHKAPPRIVIVLAAIGTILFLPMTATYRSLAATDTSAAFESLKNSDSIQRYREGSEYPEMLNALYAIRDARERGSYGLGRGYWDEIVFRLVPAQFVGADLKASLYLGDRAKPFDLIQQASRGISVGTTFTGPADSFTQFWFFGAGVYAIIGYLFRGLSRLTRGTNRPMLHVFYTNATVVAMHTVSHGTVDFLPGVLSVGLALGAFWVVTPSERPRVGRSLKIRRLSEPPAARSQGRPEVGREGLAE